ncbi:uncharacterized protein LOC131168314 [Malania oleifera]|uniref:uncharacterized protein LOC131168314 n=1 Tax=Malania oleifera TaxID=397392 RepID=UPI0025AE4B49|nr:uncharacterized protein LOC131168314 [Malania oleifera]
MGLGGCVLIAKRSTILRTKGIEVDEEKVKAIKESPKPKGITEVMIRGRILLRRGGMMGAMVDRVLKIPCKFQMGQSQSQELRRLRKQCKDWCNPLGPSSQIY